MRAADTRTHDRARDAEQQSRHPPASTPGPAGEPDSPGGHREDHQDPSHLPHRRAIHPGQHGERYSLSGHHRRQHHQRPRP
jgi:hypothetical protein